MRTISSVSMACAAIVALGGTVPAFSAGVTSDAEQVKQQSLLTPNLQSAVAKAAGYETKDIEILLKAHQATINVLNSKLNSGTAKAREAEASLILGSFSEAIGEIPAFLEVTVLHVNYVKRLGKKSSVVQQFDFFRSPAGVFVAHKT